MSKKATKCRHLVVPLARAEEIKKKFSLAEAMKQKIDTPEGRRVYAMRLAIVEPVFVNIRAQKRLYRFTLRTKGKVNIQWMLFALVHNIEKIAHYGMAVLWQKRRTQLSTGPEPGFPGQTVSTSEQKVALKK